MNERSGSIVGAVLASGLLLGCYTSEVDPTLDGVFACTQKDADCPSGLSCVNFRCEDQEIVPRLTITNPEDEQQFNDAPLDLPGNPTPQRSVEVQFTGELELVAANSGAEHVFGQGHVVLSVDGVEQLVVDSGSISSPLPVTLSIPHRPGPHRITAQAFRNDGTPYDNPEATAGRLVWVQSELEEARRPFVAIKRPWPGSAFELDDTTIEVELTTLNFTMLQPNPNSPDTNGQGHAHVYYDQQFPECLMDTVCDGGYIGVVGDPQVVPVVLPESGTTTASLTAVLRQVNHDQYRFPFGCDPVLDEPALCQPVLDTITIDRADH